MDIGKSLSFMFDDEKGVRKLLIGGLINLVPIVNLATWGYTIRTLKNVADGSSQPLPDWDDLGGDLLKGLLLMVAGLIYALPLLVLFVPVVGLVVLSGISSGSGSDVANALGAFLGLGTAGLWCLAAPYGLLVAVWLPAATANYAASGDFAAFFRFGEIWRLVQRNLGDYIIALLIAFVAGQVASWVGSIVLLVGAAFAGFWAALVYGHLLGQMLHKNNGVDAPSALAEVEPAA